MSRLSTDETRSTPSAARLKPRGSSQGGLRQYNERVVLQALRLHGRCSGAELARLTHLTAQTISLITKRLLDDGLLLKGELLRGKVGQPSVPLALNPDGAFAIGIKIGRRSLDVLLVDFTGQARQRLSLDYPFPDPDQLFDEIDLRLKALVKAAGPQRMRSASRASASPRRCRWAAGRRCSAWTRSAREVAPDRHPRARGRAHQAAGATGQGHGRRLRGRAGGRSRARHAQLPLRLRRHLHRRRPGHRQPPARRPARQCRRGRLDVGGPRRAATACPRSCWAWPR